MAYKITRKLLA